MTLSIYQRLPNFISNMKTQFRKNISYTPIAISAATRQNWQNYLCAHWKFRSGWASALRILVFLAIHWAHSERRLWSAQADLSLRWALRLLCWFYHAALIYMYSTWRNGPYGVWVQSVKLARPLAWGPTVCVRHGPCAYGMNSHTDRNKNMTCIVGYCFVNNERKCRKQLLCTCHIWALW